MVCAHFIEYLLLIKPDGISIRSGTLKECKVNLDGVKVRWFLLTEIINAYIRHDKAMVFIEIIKFKNES